MSVVRESIGKTPAGAEVHRYTMTNANGLRLQVMTYGATITGVEVPDRNGKIEDITLSLDSFADYLKGHPHLGSTCGRYAGRIAKGRFSLDGVEYTLPINNGPNHLHGGNKGFDKAVWKAEPIENADFAGVVMSYESRDGEEGYPGTLSAKITFGLTRQNELSMEYFATTDKPTIINLTNHAYWNLAGRGSGDVLGHELLLNAGKYLEVGEGLIPSGRLKAVQGTPVDFTKPNTIGARIAEAGGYDHSFVLNKAEGEKGPTLAARVSEPRSGRTMEILTTEPAIIFYTANGLDGTLRAGGVAYQKYSGLCLEAQHLPDSPHHPDFPSTVLRPGEKYRHLTIHKFLVGGS